MHTTPWCASSRLPGVALAAVLLCSGCTTVDVAQYRQEVEARNVLRLDVGREVALASKPFERLVSIVDSAGIAHVVFLRADHQIHHVTVDAAGTSHDEVIGTMPYGAPLDIVEYPIGSIRIAAGDTEYSRVSSSGEWNRAAGNRCRRYLLRTPSLYCALVASGEDVGTTARTDVDVVLVFIFPIAWPSTVRPDKLVLAEWVDGAWVVRTVIDPGTDWSAGGGDIVVGVDRGDMAHIVFDVWRGGFKAVWGLSASGPGSELRYARFPLPTGGLRGGDRKDWQEVQSEEIARVPKGAGYMQIFRLGAAGSAYRTVAVSPSTGTTLYLVTPQGVRALGTGVVGGESFELLVVSGSSAAIEGYDWNALLRVGADDSRHVLAHDECHGIWTTQCQVVYVRRSADGKLATAILGEAVGGRGALQALAIGSRDQAFAAWVGKGDSLVGRWVSLRPVATETPR